MPERPQPEPAPDDLQARTLARRERILMERFRGRYASHDELVTALHAELWMARRGRGSCIVDTIPDDEG